MSKNNKTYRIVVCVVCFFVTRFLLQGRLKDLPFFVRRAWFNAHGIKVPCRQMLDLASRNLKK